MKCKEYQVNSEIIKYLAENEITKHSKTCLEEQKLKQKHPSATEFIWLPEKQNWSINFVELNKTPPKTKKVKEKEEMKDLEEESEQNEI